MYSMHQRDRRLVGQTAVAHAMFHFYELSIPLFVAVWLSAFDVSPAVIGVVVTGSYVLIGAGSIPSGVLADIYGSRPLLHLSFVGMGVGFLVMSLAPGLKVLAIGLLVWGGAAGLYHPAALSLLTRETSQRGAALAYHGLAGNVGTAVGPIATAILLTFGSWRVSAAILALPVVPGVVIAAWTNETTADNGKSVKGEVETALREIAPRSAGLLNLGFGLVFLIMVLHGVYARGVLTFLPELLGRFPSFDPVTIYDRLFAPERYLYAGVLLLGGIGQYVGGRLTDRVNTVLLLVTSYVCICGASLLFATIDDGLGQLLAVSGALGFLIYLTAPIRQVLVAEQVAADSHGISFGYSYLGVFGFGALGATIGGVLLTASSYRGLFAVFAGLAALVVVLGLVLGALPTPPDDDEPLS